MLPLSTAALLVALVPLLGLAAVVLGPVLGRRVRADVGGRTGQALVGLGAVLALVAALLLPGVDEASRNSAGRVTATADVALDDLRPGDCVLGAVEQDAHSATVTPCARPHYGEVVLSVHLSGRVYPLPQALKALADQHCGMALDAYTHGDQGFVVDEDYPSPTAWAAGARRLLCVATSSGDDELVGSVAGGRRAA